METAEDKKKRYRQKMEILVLWAIASGCRTLRDFPELFGLTAQSSILTQYIRPMEKNGFVSRDKFTNGKAVPGSLHLTDKGQRRLGQYAVLNGKKGLEIYEVVARYGDVGELEDYK